MNMKLNKIEKIIVVILVLGVILGVGTFMFVKPSFDKIGVETKTLEAYQQELRELQDKLSRLDTIDGDIQEQKDTAKKFEGNFYPEMTTYETSEMAMAMLKAANLEAHSISVSEIATTSLSLSYFLPSEIGYELKSFAETAKNDPSADGESTVIEEGQFTDGGKTYQVTIDSVAKVTIIDENEEEVSPSKFTDRMKKIYKAALCKYAVAQGSTQTTAVMSASYEVTGAYKDYMNFIDHIYALDKATTVPSVIIPMTVAPEKEEEDENGNGTSMYVDEAGNLVSGSEVEATEQIPVEDDTEITQQITLMFLAINPMQEVTRVDADGTEIVVDQRPAIY